MYIHLGQDTVVNDDSIIAMFDIDACTISKKTRDFLALAEKEGRVVNVSYELPKSFVVSKKQGKTLIYISQLSTKTIMLRTNRSSKARLATEENNLI